MHLGQSESVARGQPNGGFVFWYDFRRGFSLHFGVNDFCWLMLFRLSKTAHAPRAPYVKTFSTYLIGLCMYRSSPESPKRAHVGTRFREGYSLYFESLRLIQPIKKWLHSNPQPDTFVALSGYDCFPFKPNRLPTNGAF